MNLFFRLFGSLLLWVSMALIVILIVLLPRDTQSQRVGVKDVMSYHFTWDNYKNNIYHYAEEVKTTKSLGTTVFNQPVEVELWLYFKRSMVVLIPAMFLSILLGITKGVFDYRLQRNKLGRFFGRGSTWLGQAVPDFFLVFLVQTLLSLAMSHGFPRLRMYGNEEWYSFLFPIVFLSMYPAFVIARYTFQALEEEEEKGYVHTAKAKGVPDRTILWKHMLKNCYPKLLQHYMPIILLLFSGMFVVEFLTSYHGIGYRLIAAIQLKSKFAAGQALPIDVPAVIGFSLLVMVLLLAAQWTGQILEYFLNPKKGGRAS
ncbi:ABC transporter permease [Neobacillus sp. OS1-32]|jgi:oligopeptide transport system permease protein|uniref:ABC transporter permease n=1 Tax=Neobacillus paridis TaxID=2803862 RepID=A0ABS1TPR7_9BACI|nr:MULTISPECIES: ABC transporter permease [Neobacillus]MBL4953320.1 ABC transporter permease [Neobacillus paridis]WML29590.1 ABC transporter permease [Neobacillus sp. OS1-32]